LFFYHIFHFTNDFVILSAASKGSICFDAKPVDDMAKLRADYQDKFGKRAYPGWDADALRERMAAD
jgi:hypothetical protein